MSTKFAVPEFYRSSVITPLKALRKTRDHRKKDLTPSRLIAGSVEINIARHFGFCFGVEHAIDVAFTTVEKNPGKRVFLISEMIHNPLVNKDLEERGVKFLMTTEGKELFPRSELTPDDIVIVPAFGTTLELVEELKEKGIEVQSFNGTCPFVEKVWNRAYELSDKGYTIVIHGKFNHEETKATFSRARRGSPVVVIKDMNEAQILASIIDGTASPETFATHFAKHSSQNFDPNLHLGRIGIINQTTMLATETGAIMKLIREAMVRRVGLEGLKDHFADTRDTLCYATNENQDATIALSNEKADFALVVGGYNSSNTSHLVEILEEKVPTYFVKGPEEIISKDLINHFDFRTKTMNATSKWYPKRDRIKFLTTCGASCPDSLFEKTIKRIVEVTQGDATEVLFQDAFKSFHQELETRV